MYLFYFSFYWKFIFCFSVYLQYKVSKFLCSVSSDFYSLFLKSSSFQIDENNDLGIKKVKKIFFPISFLSSIKKIASFPRIFVFIVKKWKLWYKIVYIRLIVGNWMTKWKNKNYVMHFIPSNIKTIIRLKKYLLWRNT